MKFLFSVPFVLCCVCLGFGQDSKLLEMKWTTSTNNISVLKQEKSIRLEFMLDSFLMDSMPTPYSHPLRPGGLKDSLKMIFTKRINREFDEKVIFSESLAAGNYNYVLRITAINFKTISYMVENYNNGGGYNRPGKCYYKDMYGIYRFEILDASGVLLCTINLENIPNSTHVESSCDTIIPHVRKITKDLYSSLAITGTRFGAYLQKLIKKSPK